MRRARVLAVLVRRTGCRFLSPAIAMQYSLCVPRSQKSQKGHSRSLTLTPLKGVSLVLVMLSSMSASIRKRFHATRQAIGLAVK